MGASEGRELVKKTLESKQNAAWMDAAFSGLGQQTVSGRQ